VAGGASLAAALLVRPQLLIVLVPFVMWRVLRSTGWVDRALVLGVPAAIGAVGVAITVFVAGGITPLWQAAQQHWEYMAGAVEGFEWAFRDLGLLAAAGGLAPGMLWLSFTLLGVVVTVADTASRRTVVALLGLVLLPYLALLLSSQNPTLPRYSLPLLALTCGLVVAGIAKIVGHPRWVLSAIGVWIAASVVYVAPNLGKYRRDPSPVVAAFDHVEKSQSAQVVAVDRRLIAFVVLERASGGLRQQMLWDYQVELGMVETEFRNDLAAVFTGSTAGWVAQPSRSTHFSCGLKLLREVASPRFLDLTVVEGCALTQPETLSERFEELEPGKIIRAR
jgi:hypothetical protein